MSIKEEPPSEEEDCDDSDFTQDLPLECMLCTKVFHKVTGLKAHVIAQHSYKTVRRKTESSGSQDNENEKHVCETCRRVFYTSTDLMVHETCHNKHTCFGCNAKFDTFVDLMNHRKTCKALHSKGVQKLKTLDDVRRPQTESPTPHDIAPVTYPSIRVKSSEELGSMELHFQIHSVRSVNDQDMADGDLDAGVGEDDPNVSDCHT